jgi:hypothetical protein
VGVLGKPGTGERERRAHNDDDDVIPLALEGVDRSRIALNLYQ